MGFLNRLRALILRGTRERDLDDELSFHLEMRTRELTEAGISPAAARRAALRAFGNQGIIKEDTRWSWGFGSFDRFRQDLIYAFRVFRKARAFTATVIVTLALGIGANTAIFSVVYGVLLKPLPYPSADRLVVILQGRTSGIERQLQDSWPDIESARARTQTLDGITVYLHDDMTLNSGSYAQSIFACTVSNDFFPVLGVRAALGRLFLPEEQERHDHVVILSDSLWRRVFNSDPGIIGRSIRLNGKLYTVVGVMPPAFSFPRIGYNSTTQAWLPMPADAWSRYGSPGSRNVSALARIKPGISLSAVRAEMEAISSGLEESVPEDRGWKFEAVPLLERAGGNAVAILVVFGAALFVLLIACANVANLMLARVATRRREVAIRAAIGAGRRRIIRQLLTESTVLAVIGGLLGLIVASVGIGVMRSLAPKELPRIEDWTVNQAVLIFNLTISIAVGVIFGLIPALQISSPRLTSAFLEGGSATRTGFRVLRNSAGSVLISTQVALSIVLLIGAGLMTRSFQRLTSVELGFNPASAATFWVSLKGEKYAGTAGREPFYRKALEQVAACPGVQTVGVSTFLALSAYAACDFRLEGWGDQEGIDEADRPGAAFKAISPGYLDAMGIPIFDGRPFTSADDTTGATPVALVSLSFARRYFAGTTPIGKRIQIQWGDNRPWREIVGVVGDVRDESLTREPEDEFYIPVMQDAPPAEFVFIAHIEPSKLGGAPDAFRAAMTAVDKDVPISDVQTLSDLLSDKVAEPRFQMGLMGAFSVLALMLTAVGLYGILNYLVAQRTHEIGIRVALGAPRRRILILVMRHGITMVIAGVAAGLCGAWCLTRFISTMLFQITPTDTVTFVAVSVLLLVVACVAVYLPARRAATLDPLLAVRYELQ